MLTTNPFAALAAFIPPEFLQGYLVLMALAVAAGTVFDLLHEGKLKFFLQDRRRARAAARRQLGAADLAAVAARTLVHDIATFGEFCNWRRRLSHALMFYGFALYLVTSIVL